MISATVDHTCFEDGIVKTRTADNLLCGPFGFVIRRATVGASTQKTHQCNFANSSLTGCFEYILGSFDVYSLIRLLANLPIDASAVGHGIAS